MTSPNGHAPSESPSISEFRAQLDELYRQLAESAKASEEASRVVAAASEIVARCADVIIQTRDEIRVQLADFRTELHIIASGLDGARRDAIAAADLAHAALRRHDTIPADSPTPKPFRVTPSPSDHSEPIR